MNQCCRVRVATVAPGVEPWRSETVLLFRSLAQLGGSLATSEKVCYFDRVVDTAIAAELLDIGVQIRLITPVDPRCAMGNNQVMLDNSDAYDWLVALDCDVVVASDFRHELVGDAVAAAPVDDALAPMPEWEKLFSAFGVSMPAVRYRSRLQGTIMPPYFNAGVLLVPSTLVDPLRHAWEHWLVKLASAFEEGRVPGSLGDRGAFVDQLAFALALADGVIPHRALPVAMNAPSHLRLHPLDDPSQVEPFLVHYHHRTDERGRLIWSGYQGIDRAIARVNALSTLQGTACAETRLDTHPRVSSAVAWRGL